MSGDVDGFVGEARVWDAGSGAADQVARLDELDRLLNDPDTAIDPDRVWTLVFEVAHHERPERRQKSATRSAPLSASPQTRWRPGTARAQPRGVSPETPRDAFKS